MEIFIFLKLFEAVSSFSPRFIRSKLYGASLLGAYNGSKNRVFWLALIVSATHSCSLQETDCLAYRNCFNFTIFSLHINLFVLCKLNNIILFYYFSTERASAL